VTAAVASAERVSGVEAGDCEGTCQAEALVGAAVAAGHQMRCCEVCWFVLVLSCVLLCVCVVLCCVRKANSPLPLLLPCFSALCVMRRYVVWMTRRAAAAALPCSAFVVGLYLLVLAVGPNVNR